jgi:hypothetical protein
MSNDGIEELEAVIRDESLPVAERRAAFVHLAKMKNQPVHLVAQIPENQIRFVVAALLTPGRMGLPSLSLADCMEAVSQGFAARGAGSQRR